MFKDTHLWTRRLSRPESCFALARLLFTPSRGDKKNFFIPRWGSIHFTRGLTESAGLKHIPRTCFLGLTPPHHFFFGLNLDSSLVLFLHSTSKLVTMLDPSLVLFLHSTSKLGLPLSPTFQMTLHQYRHKLPRTVQSVSAQASTNSPIYIASVSAPNSVPRLLTSITSTSTQVP